MDVEEEVRLGVTIIELSMQRVKLVYLRDRPALHIPSCSTMQAVSACPFAASRTKMHAPPRLNLLPKPPNPSTSAHICLWKTQL
jgi:hypothetical protein